jgi:hypothetical protein
LGNKLEFEFSEYSITAESTKKFAVMSFYSGNTRLFGRACKLCCALSSRVVKRASGLEMIATINRGIQK